MAAHFTTLAAVSAVATARLVGLVSKGVETEETIIPIGTGRSAIVQIHRPRGVPGKQPTVFFLQDGVWRKHGVHDLIEDVVVGTGAAVWMMSPPPGAALHRYQDAAAVLEYAMRHALDYDVDPMRLAIVGESSAAAVATGLASLFGLRPDARLGMQVLIYPLIAEIPANGRDYDHLTPSPTDVRRVVSAFFETEGHSAMPGRWPAEKLKNVPPTLLIVAENDVLRDGAEGFGADLASAGVEVTSLRFNGAEHGFLGLRTPQARAATALLIDALKDVFSTSHVGPK